MAVNINHYTDSIITSSGNLGIGTTNPGATLNVVPTSTSIAGLFSGTTSDDMVRITQLGTGNALVVEDSTNPDATPFVVKADGSVGIGTTNPQSTLHLQSAAPTLRFTESDAAANHRQWVMRLQDQELYWQALTDAGTGGGNLFKFTRSNEQIQTFEGLNSGVTWFEIDNSTQRVGIGTASPAFAADIAGDARVQSTGKMRFGGTAGTTNFYIQYNSTTNSLDFVAG
jgi:hypothetical protein